MHPEVATGKKTEDQVLAEFLKTFEMHHNIMNDNASDGRVTFEEFIEYYNNISSSIDNDQYFEVMMQNAWKLGESNKSYAKGWSNGEAGSLAYKKMPRPSKPYPQEAFQPTNQTYGTSTGKDSGYTYDVGTRAVDLIMEKMR